MTFFFNFIKDEGSSCKKRKSFTKSIHTKRGILLYYYISILLKLYICIKTIHCNIIFINRKLCEF